MTFLDDLRWRGLIYDETPDLEEHLEGGPRTAYIGFDPTADSLHVGSFVQIMALRRFQQHGHTPVALVGGGTGLIGDPSGKKAERQLLTAEQVRANVEGIRAQLETFLRFEGENAARMANNADWLTQISLTDFLRDVGKHFTVQQMTARESVKRRLESEVGLSFTEFSYQLLQAYDFLHLHENQGVTVQIGGSDQWGNITAGTDLVRRMGGKAHGLVQPLVTNASGTKFGKMLENGTPVLTPTGWVPVEDVASGDSVVAVDGTPTEVLGVYPHADVELFRVGFSDGTAITTHAGHLWEVNTKGRRHRGLPGRVLSTEAIAADLTDASGAPKWYLPVASPPEFRETDLPVDPYVLGVWLGDGASCGRISNVDPELWENVRAAGYEVGADISGDERSETRTVYGLKARLEHLGLATARSWERRIPEPYLFGSVRQRLALLQGLMDTDGTVHGANGNTSFTTTSEDLADGVIHLARSLGAVIRKPEPRAGSYKSGGARPIIGRPAWTFSLQVAPGLCPFRLLRKARAYREDRVRGRHKSVRSVEPAGRGNGTCIEVAHERSLFVADHFTVTHNTESGTVWLDAERTSPYRFYQFWLRTDDRDVENYLKWFTSMGPDEVSALVLEGEERPGARVAQRALAQAVTTMVHGAEATEAAERAGRALFGGDLEALDASALDEVFEEAPSIEVAASRFEGAGVGVTDLLVEVGLASLER